MSVNTVNSDGTLQRVAGGTLYADAPVGAISPFGGSVIPSGYLLCNGQAVSRTDYKELFAVIGTAYGSGDDSTTFNVPDLREATTKGTGLSGKSTTHFDGNGVALGEFVEDRIKLHAHNVYVRDTGHSHTISQEYGAFSAGGVFSTPYVSGGIGVGTNSASANIQVNSSSGFNGAANATSGMGSATTEVKAVGVNYIIKAKQVSIPVDLKETVVTNHNYSIVGTADEIADTKALIQHIATLPTGSYSGEYKRQGVTFGSYTLTYFNDGGYADSVTGIVVYGIGNNCVAYQVSYMKESSSTDPIWEINKLATEKSISLLSVNNSTIYYDKSRIVGDVVTVCADISVPSGNHLVKENAIASVRGYGTSSIGYVLPCLYRSVSSGAQEPSFAFVNTDGNIFPYYTKTEYDEIRINASYSSKL